MARPVAVGAARGRRRREGSRAPGRRRALDLGARAPPATWDRTVAGRLREWHGRDPSDAENFPAVAATTESAWTAARDSLANAHRELEEAVSSWPEDHLGEIVPGKPYSVYVMLHGAVQHELYHAGQIALLKKA